MTRSATISSLVKRYCETHPAVSFFIVKASRYADDDIEHIYSAEHYTPNGCVFDESFEHRKAAEDFMIAKLREYLGEGE